MRGDDFKATRKEVLWRGKVGKFFVLSAEEMWKTCKFEGDLIKS